jgi:hypothetical protein
VTEETEVSYNAETTAEITAKNPPPDKPDPVTPKQPHARNPLFDAVSWAWNNRNGGYVGRLIKFLTGECAPKDGQYYQWQLSPPMTPIEIVGFRLWRDYAERDMPTVPETIQRTVEEFRGVAGYERILEAAEQQLVVLGTPPNTAAATLPPAPEPNGTPEDRSVEMAATWDDLDAKLGGHYDTAST